MSAARQADSPKQLPCDQCHKRKVKCGGGTPCSRCTDSGLQCTRNIVRKKRGPKKGHGAVISRLRAESSTSQPDPYDQQTSHPSSAIEPHPPHGLPVSSLLNEPEGPEIGPSQIPLSDQFITLNDFAQQILHSQHLFGGNQQYFASPTEPTFSSPFASSSNTSASLGPFPKIESPEHGTPLMMDTHSNMDSPGFWTPSIDNQSLLFKCVTLFFQNLYPIFPLIEEQSFRAKLQNPAELPTVDRVMILSMCALTIIQVSDAAWGNLSYDSRMAKGKDLIRQALELRLTCDFTEESSLSAILTALFLQTAYFELRRRRSSWFYLREAITLAQAARLHEEAGYEGMGAIERICAQRTYALLFITERGASILSVLPVSIKYVPQLPRDILPGEDPNIFGGLQSIYTLFSLLDESFVELWNAPTEPFSRQMGQVNVAALQHNLKSIDLDAMGLTIIQSADIRVTQKWLQLVCWQAAMRQGLISSTAIDLAFTYDYPREIGRGMAEILRSLPEAAIQAHGLGIFEKQFEVAYSLLDNLTLSQSTTPEDYENLRFIFRCLSASPSSRDTYVRALQTKMDNQRRRSNPAGIEFVVNWDLRTHEGRRLSVI